MVKINQLEGFDASTVFMYITSRYVSLLLVYSKQDVCPSHDLAVLLVISKLAAPVQ